MKMACDMFHKLNELNMQKQGTNTQNHIIHKKIGDVGAMSERGEYRLGNIEYSFRTQ